jgi:hypothetical protein
VLAVGSLAGIPLGEVLIGPLTELVGTPVALVALAGLVLVVATGVALSPRVRRVDAPEARVG